MSAATAQYRWRINGREITPGLLSAAQAPNKLNISAAQPWHQGTAVAEVTNANGTVVVPATTVTVTGDTSCSSAHLANFSTHAMAGDGHSTLIAGFAIVGPDAKRVLIRGVGKGLGKFGLTNLPQNAQIRVYHGGTVIAANDDWTQ